MPRGQRHSSRVARHRATNHDRDHRSQRALKRGLTILAALVLLIVALILATASVNPDQGVLPR